MGASKNWLTLQDVGAEGAKDASTLKGTFPTIDMLELQVKIGSFACSLKSMYDRAVGFLPM